MDPLDVVLEVVEACYVAIDLHSLGQVQLIVENQLEKELVDQVKPSVLTNFLLRSVAIEVSTSTTLTDSSS